MQQSIDIARAADDGRMMSTRRTLVVSDLKIGKVLYASGPLTLDDLAPLEPFFVQLATSRRARREAAASSRGTSPASSTFVAPRDVLATPTLCRLVSVDLDRQVALWELESRPGLSPSDSAAPATEPSVIDRGGASLRRIICIENDPDGVEMLRVTLAFLPNVEFMPVATGQAGLELLHEHRPDLLLVDLQLPDISGAMVIEFCRRSTNLASMPVIVLTADASKSTRRTIEALGVTHLAIKPFDLVELRRVVDRLLPAV